MKSPYYDWNQSFNIPVIKTSSCHHHSAIFSILKNLLIKKYCSAKLEKRNKVNYVRFGMAPSGESVWFYKNSWWSDQNLFLSNVE